MASPSDNGKKPFDRMESRKSHSWWWESHTNPRNFRWLRSNLDEMDQNTADMRKLIDNDGDSLSKKADLYFRRQPELIKQVNEFQRKYRSLAERYEQLALDLQRHLSDMNLLAPVTPDSEDEPFTPRFHTDVKLNPHRSIARAAGFDVFLRNLSERSPREASPALDFEEPDFPLIHHDHLNPALPEKTIPMDTELDNNKEKTGMQNPVLVELQLKIAGYEVEIGNLKMELENVRSSNNTSKIDELQTQEVEEDNSDPEKVRAVFEELKLTKGRIQSLEKQNERLSTENKLAHQLQDLLKEAQNEAAVLKSKLDIEMRKTEKFKSSINDGDTEIRELKEKIADSDKKNQLITRLEHENTRIQKELRELEAQQAGTEKKPSEETEELKAGITERRDELEALKLKYESLMREREILIAEVGLGKEMIMEAEEEKREAIRQLCLCVEHYRRAYGQLREASTERKKLPVLIAS